MKAMSVYPKFFTSTTQEKKEAIMLIDERKLHHVQVIQNATTGEELYLIQVRIYTPEELMAIRRDYLIQNTADAFIAVASYLGNVGGVEASFARLISHDQF